MLKRLLFDVKAGTARGIWQSRMSDKPVQVEFETEILHDHIARVGFSKKAYAKAFTTAAGFSHEHFSTPK